MRGKWAKWGNSTAVRLPTSVLAAAGFSRGEELVITARHGVIELRSRQRIPTIAELFAEA